MLPTDKLTDHFRIDENHKKALKRLRIESVGDLLYHLPARYEDISDIQSVAGLRSGEEAVVYGKLGGLKTRKAWKSRRPIAEGWIEDGSARIKIMWFNQPYLAKMYHDGMYVKAAGKVSGAGEKIYLANPEIEKLDALPIDRHDSLFKSPNSRGERASTEVLDDTIYPVYRETKGVTSKWFYHTVLKCFEKGILENMEDPLPEDMLARYKLPKLKSALVWIHSPKKASDAQSARKRFAFEEVFYIQTQKALERAAVSAANTYEINSAREHVEEFTSRFPFPLTAAQKKAIEGILQDFEKPHAMSRLLEGDVGSGKTAVAATTAYAVATSRPDTGKDWGNLQVAYMAPTEILAKQHFESFIEYFSHLPIQIGLITGSGCMKFPSKSNPRKPTKISKAQLLKWAKNGEIPILIGTHALIYKSVEFKHLAYVIIDEQHRFGTRQRLALARGKERNERGTNAEKIDLLLYKDLTYAIRNILFEIKTKLGLGHKESIYQNAFEEELKHRNIVFSKERQIPITYRNKKIGVYQPDFVIDEKVVVEFKSIPFIGQKEKKQLWTYLKGSEYRLGLLVNFGNAELDIQRVIYDQARDSSSASSPRSSAFIPHLLSMTATPIPRTLALTIYGDLDITLLDEMPKGRKPVITKMVGPREQTEMYEHVQRELDAGRQAYVICPRIAEPDPDKENVLNLKSVTAEAARLKKDVFQNASIEILHSKLKPAEKDKIMQKFLAHEIDVLVATSVVEVGVNVPNATNIIIEGAERFGLSQLHQLRGRVIRSTYQPYCFAVTESKSERVRERLKALMTAKNGFELAEYDLQFRGSGELYGAKQSGLSDLGMEAIKNLKLVEAARDEAKGLVARAPDLSKTHPLIAVKVAAVGAALHME